MTYCLVRKGFLFRADSSFATCNPLPACLL